MPGSVNNQSYVFIVFVLGGMVTAFIYDLFRIKRKALKANNFFTHIDDFVFWIIAAFLVFMLVYYSNDGELRGYIFLGIFIGVILYSVSISRFIVKIAEKIIKLISSIISITIKVLITPLVFVIKTVSNPLKNLSAYSAQLTKKSVKMFRKKALMFIKNKKRFKNIRKMD